MPAVDTLRLIRLAFPRHPYHHLVEHFMGRDGARQFYALKAELEEAVREAEVSEFEEFEPLAYEPDAGGG